MLEYTINEINKHIDDLYFNFKIAKSVLPHLHDSILGKNCYVTPLFYKDTEFMAHVSFNKPFCQERILRHREAGDSVNQGFILRLFAYLDYLGVYKTFLNETYIGFYAVDLLQKLRNIFAHEIGYYDKNNPKHKEAYDIIIQHYDPWKKINKINDKIFPISIDTVILPMINDCKKYLYELDKCKYTILRTKDPSTLTPEELFVKNNNYPFRILYIPYTVQMSTNELEKEIKKSFCEAVHASFALLEKDSALKTNFKLLNKIEKLRKTQFKYLNYDYRFSCVSSSYKHKDTFKIMPIKIEQIKDLNKYCLY